MPSALYWNSGEKMSLRVMRPKRSLVVMGLGETLGSPAMA